MSREGLIRWGGPAAMSGGALYVVAWVATILIYETFAQEAKGTFLAAHAFIHMVDAPMFALLAAGAIGAYLRQADRLGKLGKVGFFLTFMGFGLGAIGGAVIVVVGLKVSDEATLGVLDVLAHPLSMLLYVMGSLIFGIATFRAGVLPRGAALMAAAGPIWLFAALMSGLEGLGQPLVLLFTPVAVTALGWMWLGHALFAEGRAVVTEPAVR